jgi:hypothetical protein
MAYRGKSCGCGESKDEKNHGRGTRNQFGDLPRHISYHDIIWMADMDDAQRPFLGGGARNGTTTHAYKGSLNWLRFR